MCSISVLLIKIVIKPDRFLISSYGKPSSVWRQELGCAPFWLSFLGGCHITENYFPVSFRCFKRWTKTKSKTTSTGSKQSMVSQIPLLDDTLSRNAVNADRDHRTSCRQLVMRTASCYQVNRKLPVSNTR